MAEYQLNIATPDGEFYSGPCEELIVRGTQGDLAVLAGHIPFMTALVPCAFRLWTPDGTERGGRLEGGLLTVGSRKDENQTVTVLTTHAEWQDGEKDGNE